MQFSEENLQTAATIGAQKISEAFTKLSGAQVVTAAPKVTTMPLKDAVENIKPKDDHAIVVYALLLSGVKGATLMTLSREDAMMLVDLLARQPIGTTGILKDIDRSAIKETLNILSNSYVNALAQISNVAFGIDVPAMITSENLNDIIDRMLKDGSQGEEPAIVFETDLNISQHSIKASLYLLFNEALVNQVERKEENV